MAMEIIPLGNSDTPESEAHKHSVIKDSLREAMRTCWMWLPERKRTLEAVEMEIRTGLDQTLKEMKHDPKTFFRATQEPIVMGSRRAQKRHRKRGDTST